MNIDERIIKYTSLTKREAFALAAMQGLLSSDAASEWTAGSELGMRSVIRQSVVYADAIIAELERTK